MMVLWLYQGLLYIISDVSYITDLHFISVGWTPLEGFGTCGQAEPLGFSTVMFKPSLLLVSLQMGSYIHSAGSCCHSDMLPRYQIATGSGDDSIRIWDMRSLQALYTIPAHLSNVSDVRFFHSHDVPFKASSPAEVAMNDVDPDRREDSDNDVATGAEEWKYRSGLYIASSGYDGLVKLWSADDWQLLRTLSTDAGKVMSVDLSSDGKLLASGTYNRNFQLFAPEDVAG
jgi:WD40 repeat protein